MVQAYLSLLDSDPIVAAAPIVLLFAGLSFGLTLVVQALEERF